MKNANKIYEEVHARFIQFIPFIPPFRKRHIKSFDFIEEHIKITNHSLVAEIGPGHVLAMIRVAHSCEVIGLGIMNDETKNALNSFGIICESYDANIDDVPLPLRGKFDCVLHLEVIEHLNRWPSEVLRETAKLLKPGGKIILSTPNFARLSNRFRMLFGKSPLINPFIKTPDGSNHVREYTMKEFFFLCDKSGLRSEAFEYYQYRLMGVRALLLPLIYLIPSLSSHMFFCLSLNTEK